MQRVDPKTYLLAYTQLDNEDVEDWLNDIGGIKVLDHLDGDDGEKLVELSGRNCYRSFDVGINPNITKIRTNSEKYHNNTLKSDHGSVLEHATLTFGFENVSRVFTHEVVRHRAGTAFCLSGDTLIYSERFNGKHRNGPVKRTIKSLYERSQNWHGKSRLKLFKLRCLDENTNSFTTTGIKSIVHSGKKDCFEVLLQDGKKIKCSKDHRFLTHDGWKRLDDIVGGLKISKTNSTAYYGNLDTEIATNGIKPYQDKKWFTKHFYNMRNTDLANLCGLSSTQITYWARKHNVRKRVFFNENEAKITIIKIKIG